MAYDTPKAIHIDAEIGGVRVDPRKTIDLRWNVARYLERQGVTNLLSAYQRHKAELILRKPCDHPELLQMTGNGQIAFYLNYPPIDHGWPAAYPDYSEQQ